MLQAYSWKHQELGKQKCTLQSHAIQNELRLMIVMEAMVMMGEDNDDEDAMNKI